MSDPDDHSTDDHSTDDHSTDDHSTDDHSPDDHGTADRGPDDTAIRRHLVVSGRVQGVFYRETLRRMAIERGVGGYARNTRDGLDAILEGPRPVVEELIKWCRQGPPHAVVIHVQVEEQEPTGEREFRVR